MNASKKLAFDLFALAAKMIMDDEEPRVERPTVRRPVVKHRVVERPVHDFTREPDGVQINVDRPRTENFSSRRTWAEAMANYRMLIDQAKKCDWPSRVPENIPPHVHANRRDWYDDNEPTFPRMELNCFCGFPF